MTNPAGSATGQICSALARGDREGALQRLSGLIREVTGRAVRAITIQSDRYSLNSINGFVELSGEGAHFFKFHHEEEQQHQGAAEFYNAAVLQEAGYPVDAPVYGETTPGREILIYRRRRERRFFDLCLEIESGTAGHLTADAVAAQQAADRRFGEIAVALLHRATAEQIRKEPIFQLFFNRTVDRPEAGPDQPLGGRIRRFYLDRTFTFPGLTISWRELAECTWRINGRHYPVTLRRLFMATRERLAPGRFGPGPAFPAHGDAHNANVWFSPAGLTLFDPAFAGAHVPALLAEVKASFHNVFAHPFWLYAPEMCQSRFSAAVSRKGDVIDLETDYHLSPLRQAFLESKARRFWRPLLRELKRRDWLAPDWERTLRLALFACPTLVMNLRAFSDSNHNPVSSAIAFAQAVRAASAPDAEDADPFQTFIGMMQ